MYREVTTKYPLLLVHGLFGFDRIGKVDMCSGLISPDTSISGKYIYRGVLHDQKAQKI